MDEPVWSHAVFSKNRHRLLNQEVARMFFARVLQQAQPHLSDEHFTVDGTLIEAWASQKSFQKKDGGEPQDKGAGANFHGEKRSNDTHESKTDPDARLYRKGHGQEAQLAYLGHVLLENRNGFIVDATVTHATGTAERDAAQEDGASEMDAPPALGQAQTHHGGRGQGLRHARLREAAARHGRARARDAKPQTRRRQRHRRAYHAACRLLDQPTQAAFDREGLRVDEANRRDASNQTTRLGQGRLAILADRRRVQPLALAETTGRLGRSVSGSAKNGVFQHAQRQESRFPTLLNSKTSLPTRSANLVEAFFNKFLDHAE